ncbi:MAG: hypothetical protein EBU66_15565 [Bacteroidetes bacterium]|nr:hypothetical protein [Bacteroidota bacterium]
MLTESHKLLLTSLTAYYKDHPEHGNILKNIINGESKLSLRVLDWFVTHYAKKQKIIYFIDDTKNEFNMSHTHQNMRKFNVYLEYRAQLQSYTKMFFDSFRRHERITFILSTEPMVTIETTVGQLNFFRWACKNYVLDYILNNLKTIEESMANYQKSMKNGNVNLNNTEVNTPKHFSGSIFVTFD